MWANLNYIGNDPSVKKDVTHSVQIVKFTGKRYKDITDRIGLDNRSTGKTF